jgi:signal transduction histidine kinase
MREALRARDVVRRLLDFARQSESTRSRASLNEVVEDVVALSKHLIHTSGIELNLILKRIFPGLYGCESNEAGSVKSCS